MFDYYRDVDEDFSNIVLTNRENKIIMFNCKKVTITLN